MCATCVGILIRSVFRVAEFAGGYVYRFVGVLCYSPDPLHRYNGTIATHEAYFYAFDTLPLWIAMSLYAVVWPARALMDRYRPLELGSRQQLNQRKSEV